MLPIVLQEKLKRLIKYLNFKDIKNKTQKQTSQEDDEVLEASGKYFALYWLSGRAGQENIWLKVMAHRASIARTVHAP